MRHTVERLHEKRQIELAKSILESKGYKVSKKVNETLDPDDCRAEIYNAWSYGWNGSPRNQNNSKRDEESEIYKKYGIQYDMSDDDAISMYKELEALHDSKRVNEDTLIAVC